MAYRSLKEFKIPQSDLSLRGYSKAAEATFFFIPELKVALDMGGIDKSVHSQYFLITHTHSDHCIHLPEAQPAFVSIKNPALIASPVESIPFVENFMHAAQELNMVQPVDKEQNRKQKPIEIRGVKRGDSFKINENRYQVDVVQCCHSVPTVGYIFSESRTKLKAEYKDIPGKQIAELRRQGTDVNENVLIKRIAFLGDTTPEVFNLHPEILQCPVVVIECTFLHPDHLNQAIQSDHTHYSQIEKLIKTNENTTFVLIHFSLRYKDSEIETFFSSLPDGKPKNVIPWI